MQIYLTEVSKWQAVTQNLGVGLSSDIFSISDFFWKLGGGIIIEHGTILGSLRYIETYWETVFICPVYLSLNTFLAPYSLPENIINTPDPPKFINCIWKAHQCKYEIYVSPFLEN